jgi:signal transduction histidine kinase
MKILGFPWTIRTRLTLLYAGAFFIACVALIVVIYLYLGQVLDRQFIVRLDNGMRAPGEVPPPMMEEAGRVNLLIRQARLNTLDTMLVASLVLVGVLTVVASGIGWVVAGQALQPLRSITATARRVADRSLHERIALIGPKDEIKDLADTLDAMLERLDRSFDSQRRFVANASHELRTPLTIARTLIEVALLDTKPDDKVRQLGTTLLAVNQRHEKLIDGLLTLASSEQHTADLSPVDLGDIASHVVSELRPLADKTGVVLETELRAGIVMGDAFLLERLIQNLLKNAIQYNLGENGWVRVRTDAATGNVELVVENTGPIVPAYETPNLFEPFRRLAATERLAGAGRASIVRGAGLGLSIVRSVAHMHAGEVQATSREGGGLVVRVRIPAAASDEVELLTAS